MDDRAEAGIGTMIVFIALVLVAAIAAGVMIDTSGKLQERSKRTGSDAANQATSNLLVMQVFGKRDITTDVKHLNITVGLAAGGDKIDFTQVKIQVSNATALKSLEHSSAAAAVGTFNVTAIRDADGSYTAESPGMTPGDLFSININLNSNGVNLAARKSLNVLIVPETGQPVRADVKAPPSYGRATVIELR
jgi:archaeal flagellin FlaB